MLQVNCLSIAFSCQRDSVFLGMCGSPLCIVMEYIPGGSVFQLLQSNKEVSLQFALQMARDTATGMAHLVLLLCVASSHYKLPSTLKKSFTEILQHVICC